MLQVIRRTALFPGAALGAFIIALFAPLAALNSQRLRRILLAITVLNIPFPVEVHLGFREEVGALGSVSGFQISLTTIALPLLYAPLLLNPRRYPPGDAQRHIQTSIPLCLYLLISVVSLTVAHDFTIGVYEIFVLFQMFLLYLYIANCITSRDDVLLIVGFLLIGLVLESSFIIGQAMGLVGDIDALGVKTRFDQDILSGLSRAGGTVGSPNETGGYLSMVLALAMGVLLARVRRIYTYLGAAGLLLGTVALVLTFTRGGWIAFLVSLATLFLLARHRIRIPRRGFVGLALTAALLIAQFSSAIETRLATDDAGSAYSRVPLMKLAALMIQDHPLLGVGVNNFALSMQPYVSQGFSGEWLYTVHNKYLVVWTEIGTFGFLAFLCFLTSALRRGWNCWKRWDSFFSPLALGCVAALMGHMVHMLVDTFRGRPTVQLVWLIAGVLAAVERMRAKPEDFRELNRGAVADKQWQNWPSYS